MMLPGGGGGERDCVCQTLYYTVFVRIKNDIDLGKSAILHEIGVPEVNTLYLTLLKYTLMHPLTLSLSLSLCQTWLG